ncbi:MAG: signal peptidase [Actinomycetota bacterium]|nr:signal peptidase [Actinomycetota bacterium]
MGLTNVSNLDDARDRVHASGRLLREAVVLVGTAMIIAFLIKSFVAQAFFIPSGSMIPQLKVGDRVVVSKVAYRLHDPHRGDIVVFDAPNQADVKKEEALPRKVIKGVLESIGLSTPSTEEYIKRVIGLPGEKVEGRDGRVYVNGRELVEPYLPQGPTTRNFDPVVLGEGQLWVMGDNRENSSDSRVFGPIPESTVVGRAFVKVWPIPDGSFL